MILKIELSLNFFAYSNHFRIRCVLGEMFIANNSNRYNFIYRYLPADVIFMTVIHRIQDNINTKLYHTQEMYMCDTAKYKDGR